MLQEYTRKDGIVVTRRSKAINNDTKLNIRISKDLLEEFKKFCKKNGINYSEMTRRLIQDYVDKEYFNYEDNTI